MPGNVQKATRPRGRSSSSSWATKHHSGRIEPAANMLCKYRTTSSRCSGEPASTKRSSSSAWTGRMRMVVLLQQHGDLANDDLGFAWSRHDVETHRPPKGLDGTIRDPFRRSQRSIAVHRKRDEDSNLKLQPSKKRCSVPRSLIHPTS